MGNGKNTIELNGRVYDASDGTILSDNAATQKPLVISPATNVDGFFKSASTAQPKHHAKHKGVATKHHRTEKSKTLMRQGLKKPHIKVSVASQSKVAADSQADVADPDTVSASRRQRAKAVSRSTAISRFNTRPASASFTSVEHLPVKPHPTETTPPPASPADSQTVHQAAKQHAVSHSNASETFQKALTSADSHTHHRLKSPKLRHKAAKKLGVGTKAVVVLSAIILVLVVGGIVARVNQSAVSMRLAAAKAGFHANLPGYTPAGFHLNGPIITKPGEITVSFQSNSDDRNFQLSQQPSNWTSSTLLSNFVNVGHQSYQIVQDRGKTIYVVNNVATWVDAGIWYQVKNNGNLSTDQLTHIADSF